LLSYFPSNVQNAIEREEDEAKRER